MLISDGIYRMLLLLFIEILLMKSLMYLLIVYNWNTCVVVNVNQKTSMYNINMTKMKHWFVVNIHKTMEYFDYLKQVVVISDFK